MRLGELLQITPAKRKGLTARQPDKRAAASKQDMTDDGDAWRTAQARATDGQADSDSADEEPPAAALSPDAGVTFHTACRSSQKSQPTPHLVSHHPLNMLHCVLYTAEHSLIGIALGLPDLCTVTGTQSTHITC
jgi:hypothetical protein